MDKLISTNLLKSKKKISCFMVQTVCIDMLSFLCIILIFVCDVVNLINDSGVWLNSDLDYSSNADTSGTGINANDSNYLFKGFLRIYKYTQLFLILILLLSLFFALKRPKVSRFLICVGIFLDLLIHMNFFQTQNDEKFILEVFVSFFLASYMSIARAYNIVQLVRYIKND